MANTLLTISMITREALRVLENSLTFTKRVRRDFDDKYGIEGAKIGTVLNIRKPPRYIGRTGQALAIEDATETSVPLALTTQYGVDIAFTSQDLALSVDDFSKRFIKPAIASVANRIDFDGLGQYFNVANEVGTPGTVPAALTTYLNAGVKLDNEACPRDDERYICISPQMDATIVDALKGLFQASTKISEQYSKGMMGQSIGFEWYMDQNVRVQVTGPQGGVPLVNGLNQSGSSVITNGWTAAAALRLRKGDVIQFANVFAVNPQNRQSVGLLRDFVVTADASSDGAGNLTVNISPAIVGPGSPFQNVSVLPTTGNAVTVNGAANISSPRGLAFHHEAFAFACADLPLPGGVDMASRVSDKQLGMSIRLIRAYDINLDRFPVRLDLLGGWATLYQEMACRIAS